MHNLHSLGSIPTRRYLTFKNCLTKQWWLHPTGYPFNTWVESSKCRLISCQRILVPCRDSNHRPSHLQSSALNHSAMTVNDDLVILCLAFTSSWSPSRRCLARTWSCSSTDGCARGHGSVPGHLSLQQEEEHRGTGTKAGSRQAGYHQIRGESSCSSWLLSICSLPLSLFLCLFLSFISISHRINFPPLSVPPYST